MENIKLDQVDFSKLLPGCMREDATDVMIWLHPCKY